MTLFIFYIYKFFGKGYSILPIILLFLSYRNIKKSPSTNAEDFISLKYTNLNKNTKPSYCFTQRTGNPAARERTQGILSVLLLKYKARIKLLLVISFVVVE